MSHDEILENIKLLAKSQGYYARLLETLGIIDQENYNDILNHLENQNFRDVVDLVMYFES